MKSLIAIFVVAVLAFAPAVASAVTLVFDNATGIHASVVTNTDGSQYFNEFGDGSNPVPVSGPGQAAIGNGSWQAAATGSGYNNLTVYSLNTGSGGINEAAFTGFSSGSAVIRVRDIESFSWATNKMTGPGADWFVQIYTLPGAFGDPPGDSAWYSRRMTFENAYAYNQALPINIWNVSTTDASFNQVGMSDSAPGPASTNIGFFGAPTLQDVAGSAINWDPASEGGLWPISGYGKGASGSTATIDYRDEIVWLIRINVASGNTIATLIDDFNFQLKSSFDAGFDTNLVAGQSVTIDFEDPNFVPQSETFFIPEPSSLGLISLGSLLLFAARRRRR